MKAGAHAGPGVDRNGNATSNLGFRSSAFSYAGRNDLVRPIDVADAADAGRYDDFAFAFKFDDHGRQLSHPDGDSDFIG